MLPFVIVLFIALSDVVLATRENIQLQKKYYDLNDAENFFNEYVREYKKSYADEREFNTRFEIFKQSLRNINKWNAMYPLTVFDINQFSDQTQKEFREKYNGLLMDPRGYEESVINYAPSGYAPDALDYRTQGLVSEVKDQGSCGSCYVFSAIGNIEGQYAKKYSLVSLSEQQCLDCHKHARGCGGGIMHKTMKALATEGGSMKEKDYPYNGKDYHKNQCKFNKDQVVAKVSDGIIYNVTDEEQLKDALASIGPLAIAIYSSEAFAAYTGGIYTTPCDEDLANHGVLLVGYGSEGGVDYWIIKNSWSAQWGEKGYIRYLMGKKLCLIGSYVATATVV